MSPIHPQILRRVLPAAVAAGIILLLVLALRPRPALVETALILRGPLSERIEEEGVTRVRERYIVSAPAGGRLERIALRPGDSVAAGDRLALLTAPEAPLLDPRSRAEAEAALKAARASEHRAQSRLDGAQAIENFARENARRARALFAAGSLTQQELETSEERAALTASDLAAARADAEAARAEVERARAVLRDEDEPGQAGAIPVHAPADGRVFRVFQESAAVVAPGTPLLELGDPRALELVIDVLSSDAVRIPAAAAVLLDHWGGEPALRARVRSVEPAAFTRVSALGVEEQRVNVIADFSGDPPESLGDGFRFEAAIVVWESSDVLQVPAGALFRAGGEWAVFRIEGNRARLQRVILGRGDGRAFAILEGLSQNDRVIVHPPERVSEGVRVEVR